MEGHITSAAAADGEGVGLTEGVIAAGEGGLSECKGSPYLRVRGRDARRTSYSFGVVG